MKRSTFATWFSILTLSALSLTGCQTTLEQPKRAETAKSLPPPLSNAYSFSIIDSKTQKVLTVPDLAQAIQKSDVVFIGEFHGNHASHLLEMQLQTALYKLRPQQVLSMEMFNRDQQTTLNRYLDNEVGEKYLINEAPAWPNYVGSYRPMIEFAKQHFIPVIAANAAADIVRCIGEHGQTYVNLLHKEEREWIARQAFKDNGDYRQKFYEFMDSMRPMDETHKAKSYAAQLARDNTMAESILKALHDFPQHQVIHLNGSFHSESFLGTVALLKQRRPELKITVITPLGVENPQKPQWTEEDLQLGDYLYLLTRQPKEFQSSVYKRQIRQAMFKNAQQKSEQCRRPE
ncbi:ChaN family lipoprotein [Thiomicrorhabdus xiamenensis]|uniref:ChaN family lipoprotein n=1 Tax=Thiomicrorhabdus xiamenensis TaxID=2739063 RepID=A0A7D4SRC8_9GAMM|nr:ChaN family lipoprotein [Thiomicrorhabdus xiamenensis]QKI88323.1 ChaN family lipoprotein [Thiomicrorhabdus xiamenensis]